MGVDPSSSSSRRAPLRCNRRVRLSLAFCFRMCRIPRRLVHWVGLLLLLLDDAGDSRRSDDPWKDDHASTLVGQVRHAVVTARARAAVEADGRMIRPILKQNNETCHLAEFASLPGSCDVRIRTTNAVRWQEERSFRSFCQHGNMVQSVER